MREFFKDKKIKKLSKIFTALAIAVIYFYLLGGFNSSQTGNNYPYPAEKKYNTDFVKEINKGRYKPDTLKHDFAPENSKIKMLLGSQRTVINAFKDTASVSGELYFKTANGYRERSEEGKDAVYLSSGNYKDGRQKMKSCYALEFVEQADQIYLKYDSALSFEWNLKPMMKIRRADFSMADTRKVAAIILLNPEGRAVDSVIIKVRNFSSLSGEYPGFYTDKFMSEFELPGNSLKVNAADFFKKGKFNGLDVKIYWFGEVDLWIEKLTIDDNTANSLLEGLYDFHITEESTEYNLSVTAGKVKDNSTIPANYPAINYIMNLMYRNLKYSAVRDNKNTLY